MLSVTVIERKICMDFEIEVKANFSKSTTRKTLTYTVDELEVRFFKLPEMIER